MRKRGRVDGNQEEVVAALRKAGCSVLVLSAIGGGCPDILVGRRHKNWLLEIKDGKGAATPQQRTWHQRWNGQVATVRTSEEALIAVGATMTLEKMIA